LFGEFARRGEITSDLTTVDFENEPFKGRVIRELTTKII